MAVPEHVPASAYARNRIDRTPIAQARWDMTGPDDEIRMLVAE